MAALTLVDLGSGYGAAAQLAFHILNSRLGGREHLHFRKYVAVDTSPKLLKSAVSRARDLGIDTGAFRFDLDTREGTRPPACIGDIVLLAYVLTHLSGAEPGLYEAARVAKDYGIVLVIDSAYSTMEANGDEALVNTVNEIRQRLRHRDFPNLDTIARHVGLRRLSGLDDVDQWFGPGELDPKLDALAFVGRFLPNDPARIAWEQIRSGALRLTHIRRAYVKESLR